MIKSLDARNEDGQTLASHAYKGKTEGERIQETTKFMQKYSHAFSFKHFGDEVWTIYHHPTIRKRISSTMNDLDNATAERKHYQRLSSECGEVCRTLNSQIAHYESIISGEYASKLTSKQQPVNLVAKAPNGREARTCINHPIQAQNAGLVERRAVVAQDSEGRITSIKDIDFKTFEERLFAVAYGEAERRETLARQRRTFRKRVW